MYKTQVRLTVAIQQKSKSITNLTCGIIFTTLEKEPKIGDKVEIIACNEKGFNYYPYGKLIEILDRETL